MGYYTKFAIRIKNKYNTESNLKKLSRVIELVSGYIIFPTLILCSF